MPSTLAVCRLMTNSNLVGCMIAADLAILIAQARSVAHQPSGFGNFTKAEHRRQRVARRQGDELGSTVEEKRVGADQKSIGPLLHQAGKGDIDLVAGTGANDVQFPADGRSRRLRLRDLGLYNHYQGQPKQIAAALWGNSAAQYRYKHCKSPAA
jgi:hypothetical protein